MTDQLDSIIHFNGLNDDHSTKSQRNTNILPRAPLDAPRSYKLSSNRDDCQAGFRQLFQSFWLSSLHLSQSDNNAFPKESGLLKVTSSYGSHRDTLESNNAGPCLAHEFIT
jgi:hypothetical protein